MPSPSARTIATENPARRYPSLLELPDSSHFTALLEDPRFYAVLGVTLLCGVVRGFSGFGGALIYIPLVSAIAAMPGSVRVACRSDSSAIRSSRFTASATEEMTPNSV